MTATRRATSSQSSADSRTAQSTADLGGICGLIAAATTEGWLDVITPPGRVNGATVIDALSVRYAIAVDPAQPDGSSEDVINAVRSQKCTDRAPDVLGAGTSGPPVAPARSGGTR